MSLPKVCRLAALLLMPWGPGASAQTPGAGPVLIVTYVEAPPAKAAALAADLHAYGGQIENGPGKPRVTVLREFGRPNRMVIIEQWPDSSSPSFAKSETRLAAMVQPDVLAPMDRRVNHPLTPALIQMASMTFVVLMHVDMSLAGPAALKVLQAQRDSVLAAPDALGYEDAVQDQHENHSQSARYGRAAPLTRPIRRPDRRRISVANLRPSLDPPSMIASMSAWGTDRQIRWAGCVDRYADRYFTETCLFSDAVSVTGELVHAAKRQ
jgi:hypothetical protein